MISYREAINKINEVLSKLDAEVISLSDAEGRVGAKAVFSSLNVPSFNNSAMDGFAVRFDDLTEFGSVSSNGLDVIDCVKAGDSGVVVKTSLVNTACAIMTGAPLPEGYDTVIRIEDVRVIEHGSKRRVLINKPVEYGANVRLSGQDFQVGDTVLEPGVIITPEVIMGLAAVGINQVAVIKKPSIALFCTGDELQHNTALKLMPGKIFNSSAPYIQANMPYLHSQLSYYEVVSDNKKQLVAQIQHQLDSLSPPDVILTTGGVSAGDYDFIPDVLAQLGADIIFHKVCIRPGKPILFAKFKGSYIIGLPGNPVSTAVGLRFFLYPLIHSLLGISEEKPLRARLLNEAKRKGKLRFFYKAKIKSDNMGQLEVELLAGQESFKIKPLLQANCWAVLTEKQDFFSVNDVIDVFPLYPLYPIINGGLRNE